MRNCHRRKKPDAFPGKGAPWRGKRLLGAVVAVIAWLGLWQIAAGAAANPWVLPGPLEVLVAWGGLVVTAGFWQAVGNSLGRIALGFFVALAAGAVLGYGAFRLPVLRAFLKPAVMVVKSAPVVCVIALLLVAAGSGGAVSIVVGLVVFPPFYHGILEAALGRNRDIDQVLRAFRVPMLRRILCAELPAFGPSLRAAVAVAAGLAWKSGVAAELIGLPGASIGEGVYLAKISLNSAQIIAWTATVIALGWLSEKGLRALVDGALDSPRRWLGRRVTRAMGGTKETMAASGGSCSFSLQGVVRDFGGQVLRFTRLFVAPGQRLCLMAPSGTGKTTLLRLIAAIDRPQDGRVLVDANGEGDPPVGATPSFSVMLQQSTLLPWASALENVALVAVDADEIRRGAKYLGDLLGEEAGGKLARELSGGMERRAELARALAHPSCAVILDEPFAGLDRASKERCLALIDRALEGRTLILATHDAADAQVLGADVIGSFVSFGSGVGGDEGGAPV